MPSFLKYGSTGRPPGKFHIRHSPKKITENLEFSHPPFDIFFIEIANNNNNNNNNNNKSYIDNGGNAVSAGNGNYSDSDAPDDAEDGEDAEAPGLSERLADRLESNRCNYKYKYKFNIDGISTTTTTAATPAPTTINYKTRAEGISTEDGEDVEAPGLSERLADRLDILFIEITNNNNNNINYIDNGGSGTDGTDSDTNDTNVVGHRSNQIAAASEWFANRFESNRCNYNYKYKFNNDGISTTTTTTTPAPATINYKTSAEGISDEGGEDAEAPGVSERLAVRFVSNHILFTTNNNIDITNNNNTNYSIICYYNNGGTIDDEEGDIKECGPYGTSLIGTVVAIDLNDCSLNQMISNNNNTNNNNKNNNKLDTSFSYSTDATTTNSTINHNTSTYDDNKEADTAQRIHWFNTANNNKHHHHHQQQQQQHYHGKQRHQFHLEQQQKHQHFKQEQHNMERMVTSIVLKLSLVAWDMWAFRNVF